MSPAHFSPMRQPSMPIHNTPIKLFLFLLNSKEGFGARNNKFIVYSIKCSVYCIFANSKILKGCPRMLFIRNLNLPFKQSNDFSWSSEPWNIMEITYLCFGTEYHLPDCPSTNTSNFMNLIIYKVCLIAKSPNFSIAMISLLTG